MYIASMLHGSQLCASQQALISTIQEGDFSEALAILKRNPSLNVNFKVKISNEYITTPLIEACQFAAKELVLALLARGADPQWYDHSMQTALHTAVVGQDIKLEDGQEVDKNPVEALEDRFTIIRALCKINPNLLQTGDHFGNTPLHLVALQGKKIVGDWLLTMDSSLINLTNNKNETPAQILRRRKDIDEVTNLMSALTVAPLTMLCQRKIAQQPQLRELVLRLPADISEEAMSYHPQGISKRI